MGSFIHDDFILNNKTAVRLYHQYAEKAPIFDYHCHLSPKEIYEDKRFNNITEVWLGSDHYKWRLLRANGVEEKYVTGDADPYHKFLKWADTIPKTLGNPLYHWTHLELKRCFGIDELLSPKTADKIWETCNKKLGEKDFSARSLIKRFNVRVLCTTDDPIDDLKYHIELAQDKDFGIKVLPTFRPEKALSIESKDYSVYIEKLSRASGIMIDSYDDLVSALKNRAEFFKSVGCKVSDHSFGSPDFTVRSKSTAIEAFTKALNGENLYQNEVDAFKTELMIELGRIYHSLGFIMQLHVGVIRNTNERMFRLLGPDTGFDTIGNGISADSLIALLNALELNDELPKTIIYSLNDKDNDMIAAVMGCFQSGGVAGKVQLGSAWWFNDHYDGMMNQLKSLASIGLLSRFIGMLTDSRSFLSYPRHEYFRRILCNLIGEWAEQGMVPKDEELLGQMVEDICINNVVKYFGMEF